jgi:hypothetical protein
MVFVSGLVSLVQGKRALSFPSLVVRFQFRFQFSAFVSSFLPMGAN